MPVVVFVLVETYGMSMFMAQFVVNFAISVALSTVSQALFGKKPTQQQGWTAELKDRMQVIRSSTAPRNVIYGEIMISGPLPYATSTGDTNQYLHLVIALAGHECEAIGDIYFNDVLLGDLDGSGNVITGVYSGKAQVTKHLGTASQAADVGLITAGTGWAASDQLLDTAYLYVRLEFDQNVYPTGIPNIKAVVKGKKVYDPRSLTTVWSDNWALCCRDYLHSDYGLAAPDAEIDDTACAAAANIADESVTITAGTGTGYTTNAAGYAIGATAITLITGSGTVLRNDCVTFAGDSNKYYVETALTAGIVTLYAPGLRKVIPASATAITVRNSQSRYTCNGSFTLDKTPSDIMGSLLTAGVGAVTFTQGKYTLKAGAYDTPTVTLTGDDLRGPIQVQTAVTRRELFNAVRGTFVNPLQYWQPSDFPAVKNATYATQDGSEIYRDITLPFTTDMVAAQRIAKIHLEKSRQGITVTFPATYAAFKVRVWDTIMLTIPQMGWSAKPFIVLDWTLVGDGGVDLTLQEEDSGSYSWAMGDATTVDRAPNTNLPSPFTVAAPGTPVITETLYSTSGSAGVKSKAIITCTASPDVFVRQYHLDWKLTSDSTWTEFPPQTDPRWEIPDLAAGTYSARVTAINGLGVNSAYSITTTKDLLGLTAPPADISGFSFTKISGVGVAAWTLSGDLDVRIGGRIVIRHSPLTSGATWNDGYVLDEFNGDAVTGLLPLITGTYMIKAKDSSDNYSVNMSGFVATEGMITGFTTVGTSTQAATFSGTKTNVSVSASVLALTDPAASLTGSYAFSTYMDLTTVATRRFEADIATLSFDTTTSIDSMTALIDTWGFIDGGYVNDCDVTLYAALTNDDPAGSPTWGAWTPFFVSDFTCRAAKFKLDFLSGQSTHNISVSTLTVHAKTP